MPKEPQTRLFPSETAIVSLKRGQVVKLNGVPLELLANEAAFKTAANNVRILGRSCEVIDQYADETL